MNKEQIVHIAMTNSYKILTEECTIDDVIKSGLMYFAHHPEEGVAADELLVMVSYFESKEQYNECHNLMAIYNQNFNADGSYKDEIEVFLEELDGEQYCQCAEPKIKEYTEETYCLNCNKRIQ